MKSNHPDPLPLYRLYPGSAWRKGKIKRGVASQKSMWYEIKTGDKRGGISHFLHTPLFDRKDEIQPRDAYQVKIAKHLNLLSFRKTLLRP